MVCSTTWLCVLMAVCVALLSLVVRVQDTLKLQAAVQQTDLLFTVPGAADGAAPLDTAQLAQVYGELAQLNVGVKDLHRKLDAALGRVAVAQDAVTDANKNVDAHESRVIAAEKKVAKYKKKLAKEQAALAGAVAQRGAAYIELYDAQRARDSVYKTTLAALSVVEQKPGFMEP